MQIKMHFIGLQLKSLVFFTIVFCLDWLESNISRKIMKMICFHNIYLLSFKLLPLHLNILMSYFSIMKDCENKCLLLYWLHLLIVVLWS